MSKFQSYRMFDLVMLSVIAVFAEITSIVLGQLLPGAGFYVSFSGMVVIIALIRWRQWGFVVSVLSAIPLIFFSEMITVQLILYYLVSSSMVGLVPFVFSRIKTEKILKNGYIFLLYILSYYGILFISRGLIGTLMGYTFVQALTQAFIQLAFSLVMSSIFLMLFRKREGLLIDMTTYIYKEVIQE